MQLATEKVYINHCTISNKYPFALSPTMPSDIEQHYADLKKKHSLPDFAVLDREFEVSTIEKPAFLLRAIRRKVGERIDAAVQLIDPLIQPDAGSYANLTEYRALTEADRKELLKHFQHVMELSLACIDAEMSADDAQDAVFIRRAAAEWPAIRESLRPFVQKIGIAWTKSVEHKNNVGYFG
jgi:C-terminal processing protease CtpA/Prc